MMQGEKPSSAEQLSFEAALLQLQEIVMQLEEGSLPLEESLTRFEEGTRLLKACHAVLQNAERKIEVLTNFTEEGEAQTAPFDDTATYQEATASAGKRKSKPKASKPAKPASNPVTKFSEPDLFGGESDVDAEPTDNDEAPF